MSRAGRLRKQALRNSVLSTGYHYSSYEMLGLTAEVNKRIRMVFGKRIMLQKGQIFLTTGQQQLLKNARELNTRFSRNEYRHTLHEEGQLVELCHLLVSMHAEHQNLQPRFPDINRDALRSKKPPAGGTYGQALAKSADGWAPAPAEQ